VLPVLAQMTACAPSATAWVMAVVMPRSLNEPVGLAASYFKYNSNPPPSAEASRGAGINGVLPSSNVTGGTVCAM